MKKIYIKYKVLVNGLPLKEYNVDGFTLKTSKFEEGFFDSKYNVEKSGLDLNMNCYLTSCLLDYNDYTYNYFESDDYLEIEIPDQMVVSKDTYNEVMDLNKEILDKVEDFEQKLRLVLNIPLLFQIICIEFYDENKKYISAVQGCRKISFWNRLLYNLNVDEFNNNSRFHFDFNSMKNTSNKYFNRALEFYNDSFESEKRAIRYVLVFSSLEAIFNLDSKNIKHKISKYSAKLLAEYDKDAYSKIYNDIKGLYKKRCDYIHGSNRNSIQDEDEKLLRNYVRKIIIAYWLIIIYSKKSASQILGYLDSKEKIDVEIRMMIAALNSNDFSSQQHRLIELLEKDYNVVIPEETKKFILSNRDKTD